MLKKVKVELRNEVGIKMFGKPIRHMEANVLNIRQIFTLLRDRHVVKVHEFNEDETLSVEVNIKNYDKATDWEAIKAEVAGEETPVEPVNEDPVNETVVPDEVPVEPVNESPVNETVVPDEVPVEPVNEDPVNDIVEEDKVLLTIEEDIVIGETIAKPAVLITENTEENCDEGSPVVEETKPYHNPKAGKKHKK